MSNITEAYRKLVRESTMKFIEKRLTDEFLTLLQKTVSEFTEEVSTEFTEVENNLSSLPDCRLKESTLAHYSQLKKRLDDKDILGMFAVATMIGDGGDAEELVSSVFIGDVLSAADHLVDFDQINLLADQGMLAEEIAGHSDLVVEDVEEYLAKRKG